VKFTGLALGLFGCGLLQVGPACAIERAANCTAITAAEDRLACYDQAAREPTESTTRAESPAPVDRGNLSSYSPLRFSPIGPGRLFATPSKYEGKPIQLRQTQCLYAGKDEVRCIRNGDSFVVMIMASTILPAETQSLLEADCATPNVAMLSEKCRKTIRFVPLASEIDEINVKRVTFFTHQIQIAADEHEGRRPESVRFDQGEARHFGKRSARVSPTVSWTSAHCNRSVVGRRRACGTTVGGDQVDRGHRHRRRA
jgi:hypothetical protein